MKHRPASLPDVFGRAIAALPATERIAIAYSGGLDSSVLLHLAHAANMPLVALHVHHGLSANADAWEAHCAAVCGDLGVPFASRRVTLVDRNGKGTEASARQARYAALGELCREHGATLLLTAHHLDDQAETILLQLARGAGPAGLSGMDAFNTAPGLLGSAGILLARPLLQASRAELEAYARAHGVAHIEDESNADTRYPRNALRHTVMPALAAAFPGFQERFARSAAHAQSATRLLEELAAEDLHKLLADDGSASIESLRALSEDRRANVLRHWFHVRGIRIPSAAWLAQMTAQVLSARDDAQVLVVHPDCDVRRHRGRLFLVAKQRELAGAQEDAFDERPSQHFRWNGEASLAFPDYGGTLHFETAEEGVPADWLRQQLLSIAFRRGGERLKPASNRPSRDLKHHYQALGVPAWERPRLPIVSIPGRVLFAAGIGMDCHFVAHGPNNRVILRWVAE